MIVVLVQHTTATSCSLIDVATSSLTPDVTAASFTVDIHTPSLTAIIAAASLGPHIAASTFSFDVHTLKVISICSMMCEAREDQLTSRRLSGCSCTQSRSQRYSMHPHCLGGPLGRVSVSVHSVIADWLSFDHLRLHFALLLLAHKVEVPPWHMVMMAGWQTWTCWVGYVGAWACVGEMMLEVCESRAMLQGPGRQYITCPDVFSFACFMTAAFDLCCGAAVPRILHQSHAPEFEFARIRQR